MPGRTRFPVDMPAEVRAIFEDIYQKLDRLVGVNNVDLHGRRIINAGKAVDDTDYVTMADLQNYVNKTVGRPRGTGSIIGAGGGAGGGGSTGGGGDAGCSGRTEPTVEFPDDSSVVADYATAHPGELADSCQPPDGSGTWDFMDGVVAALQAVDNRYGYNAKRGNCDDPSHDAISYYFGELGAQTACSQNCYVIDIISGHCGDNPGTTWLNQTAAACGGWLPER